MISFSQKKAIKKIQTNSEEININTAGLDNIILENSASDFLEIYLFAEDYDEQLIKIDEKPEVLKINFEFKGTETREVIFRKFITKRLQRASVVVKIPKSKKVIIFGENVDISSKNIKNKLSIYIDNGIVKLDTVKENTLVKFYSGNIYATANKMNIDVLSNLGKIKLDTISYQKKYISLSKNSSKELKIVTIKGNIFLKSTD